MFQPCLFKNKSVVIYEVQEKFPSYTKPLLAAAQGRAGLTQSCAPAGKRRSGPPSAQGPRVPFPVLAAGKTPRPPPSFPAHPAPPPHPWKWDQGQERGEGRQNALGCPGGAAAAELSRPGVTASSLPRAAAWFCSGSAQRPHPHPALRANLMGAPGMSPGSVPRPGRALPSPRLLPGLSSAAPARGGRRAQRGVLRYQNSKEQGSALSP